SANDCTDGACSHRANSQSGHHTDALLPGCAWVLGGIFLRECRHCRHTRASESEPDRASPQRLLQSPGCQCVHKSCPLVCLDEFGTCRSGLHPVQRADTPPTCCKGGEAVMICGKFWWQAHLPMPSRPTGPVCFGSQASHHSVLFEDSTPGLPHASKLKGA